MVRKKQFHYPNKPFPEAIHTHVCPQCGAKRKSTVNPKSDRAPKLCAQCSRARQNKILNRVFWNER